MRPPPFPDDRTSASAPQPLPLAGRPDGLVVERVERAGDLGDQEGVPGRSADVACEQGPASETVVPPICQGCSLVDEVVCEGLDRALDNAAAPVDFAARKPAIELEGECTSGSRR